MKKVLDEERFKEFVLELRVRIEELVNEVLDSEPEEPDIVPFETEEDKDDGIDVVKFPLRRIGEYEGKGIYLESGYDYRILKDRNSILCLVRFKSGKAPRRSDV